MDRPLKRRRMITITAATAMVSMLPFAKLAQSTQSASSTQSTQYASKHWMGSAMGAQASMTLYDNDGTRTANAIKAALDEITRLEKVFSLFREDSALSILNRDGVLPMPPIDLVVCLMEARRFFKISGGAFDPSIQPLWELYAKHYKAKDADTAGPAQLAITNAQSLVDFGRVHISMDEIKLGNPNMALSLNGIAQGYITDKVTDLLRRHGFEHVLINMGETRTIGNKPDGLSWQVAIKGTDTTLPLNNQAMATSGGYGTTFDTTGKHHHLFDPATGESTNRWSSISVVAPTATIADALSTAFSVMTKQEINRISKELSVVAYLYKDFENQPILLN